MIKDKVEIKPVGQQTLAPGTESAVSGPNSFYYPVLRRVDYGKYVVVKSGELKFYFKEATSYGIENADDLVLTYSINGPNFNTQDSIKIADILGDPIIIKENADISCSETQMYFSPNLSYGVSPTDDTFIVHSEPGQTPNTQNFGDDQRLVATGHYNPSDHPDSANTSTYIKYGIGQLETNAELEEAIFSIIAEISGTKTNGNFRIYKVNGYWDEESLSYATRPATYLPATTTLTPDDILEVDGVGYDYSKGITSLVNDWINGNTDDHGIRISSDSSHYFVSKDNLFEATSQSTITLNLTNNASTQSSPVLSLGYVEAGDTLSLDYLDYDVALNHVFTTNPADAEEIVSFGERTNCQTDNGLSFYPFIEEDTTQAPYFEFVLNRDLELTDLDIDTTQYIYYQDVYIEPRIKFDNGSSPIPEFLFDFSYRMELYDVPSVALSNSSQERFVALLDGDPDGGEALYDDAGADILVLNRPETQGKKFKLRVMGEFKKGFTLGKGKPGDYSTSEVKDAVQEIFPGKAVSNIASDPYCGLTEAYVSRNGVFVNCFEFTIGSSSELVVKGQPETIAPADTTLIALNYIDGNGDTLNFPSDQMFSTGIDEAHQQFGTLLTPDETDTADVFQETFQGFSFIASPTSPDTTIPVIVTTDFNGQTLIDTAQITIRSESLEIMLGESKYFYTAEDPEDNTKLLIKELEIDAQSEDPVTLPSGGLADAFSSDDLIEVISGGKSGVYWERKRALIDNNGSITVQDLPDGIVRVIGRYWEDGKDYKVKLKASSGSRIGKLKITVVKPDKLGENDNQRIYTDALESEYNLDSLSIAYGGRTGMPPQFLKGIISQESSRLASYRYEPGTDLKYNAWRSGRYAESDSVVSSSMQDNQYWITDENDEGDPAIPLNHIVNEQQGNNGRYPGYNGTMYDLFNQNRETEINRRDQVIIQLESFRIQAYDQLTLIGNPSSEEVENLAQDLLSEWLQNTYRGGLSNIAKQTRIIASYGPMQLIYLYAYYDGGFPVNDSNYPEYLNDDVDLALDYSIRFYIRNKFNPTTFSTNNVRFSVASNWPNGFEESLKRAANAYNGKSGADAETWHYGKEVWLKALNYLPSK
ncbi:MAG: DNRLRE domain-containing protein [Gracilimonas sp.]|uniref:DNRLRE domain-containing protein n=1 Tax=Gracilimonas sp. TaxID=1974203 RepID=UPI0032EF4550